MARRIAIRFLVPLMFLAGSVVSRPAATKPEGPALADDATRKEAAQRFDRALQLFEAGDNASALAEFKRIYEIAGEQIVLYNIGLVYAAMARPVEAVDALERVLQSGRLTPSQLEHAQKILDDQQARIGRLVVVTSPEGAKIEVDNIEVAQAPMGRSLRVSEGSHVVGAVAEGFAPARKEVLVAGNSEVTVRLQLVPTQSKQMANLLVRDATLDADLLVDGTSKGKTPLESSITLAPGRHTLELRRQGYVTMRREIELGPGATSELSLRLSLDRTALEINGALLVLDLNESTAELRVDGEMHGIYRGPVRLPPGPHHIQVNAAGYVAQERDVVLEQSKPTEVRFDLELTPERRRAYKSNAQLVRTAGWIGVIAGVVVSGTGTALAVVASSQKSDAEAKLSAVLENEQLSKPPCDHKQAYVAESNDDGLLCKQSKASARGEIADAKNLRLIGLIGAGVGGAVAVTGLVLILAGNDPHKYDKSDSRVSLAPGPGDFGTSVQFAF